MNDVIPNTYAEWRYCIEEKCGIPLTLDFVSSRIESLQCASSENTKKFCKLYGEDYWRQVIAWFEQAREGLEKS